MTPRRAAIVTGASSGIGRALADRAARSGYDVLAVGRRGERLERLLLDLEGAPGRLVTLALDLREPRAAERVVEAARAAFGRIDVLVNNAGGVAVGPIGEQSDGAIDEQLRTHVAVPLALLREALPSLRATRGQVFFVGSGVARVPVGGLGVYPAAKAAVRNMTRIVRNDLAKDGIAVTYVDPGAVASEFMTRAGFAGPPAFIAASPHAVARRIFKAFRSRRRVVNAVPWQTVVVGIGEAFPALADFVLSRAGDVVGTQSQPAQRSDAPPQPSRSDAPSGSSGSEATPQPSASDTPSRSSGSVATPRLPASDAPAEAAHDTAGPPASNASAERARASALAAVLEPIASRMERNKFRETYVRSLLEPGRELETASVAANWAGMPNKIERRITHEALELLADAGYLARVGEERYRVERAPEG